MPPSWALLGGFAIGARVALLWQHYGNAWQSPAVIRQAHRTPHACRTRTLRMLAKTPLAGDKIDASAACALPFHPYCGGVTTRTRNVSEYKLLFPLCLVKTSLSCRRRIARRSALRLTCGKQRWAFSVINLRRSNSVDNTFNVRRAVGKSLNDN